MCGRASLTKNQKEIEDRFNATFYSEDIERYNPIPNYNLGPFQYTPVITGIDDSYFKFFRWGLIPFWSKDEKFASKLINARVETIDEKKSFKGSFERRRCLIPLDGFYEWKKNTNVKKPYRIVLNNKQLFSVAGLWDSWKGPNQEIIETFTIITVPANSMMRQIHHRMPAILFKDQEKDWLDNDISTNDIKELLKPYPSDLTFAYPVSTKLNNIKNNSKDLIIEIPEENISQGSLF